jgi:hypothetical protein
MSKDVQKLAIATYNSVAIDPHNNLSPVHTNSKHKKSSETLVASELLCK